MKSIRVGLVGTGYAAKIRAEAFQADPRSQLVGVAGNAADKTQAFSQTYEAEAVSSWQELVGRSDIDLVVISNVNAEHGTIVQAALQHGKHVVVEYPLSLDLGEAEALIKLAAAQETLLHVEHIELLSGIHLAIQGVLAEVGEPFYVRYTNLVPQRPAPQKWTYHPQLFGFPLMGAVSRIHRLTNLFGRVASVSSQARFWGGSPADFYTACLCTAQLKFASGLAADVVYGKGDAIWQSDRTLQIHAAQGAILIDGETGKLVLPTETRDLDMGSRRGLFAKDTAIVLDHLTTGAPLYVAIESSLHALRVADAARRSAETGQVISV
ncbi:Gfo/Idh/MocA family oxidoreductase [Phormidium tenue FACHB-886]|nr:Gfo/Idh/MocA family oxidoreductase [Phormidium tenue FACHB-886]